MENYKELYRIVIEHDYFEGELCNVFACVLTRQGAELAKRRDFYFKQVKSNEWVVYYQKLPVENDVLTIMLSVNDPLFPLYTDWEAFRPSFAYELDLPSETMDLEANKVFVLNENKKEFGTGTCIMKLCIDKKICNAAEKGFSTSVSIHFGTPSVKWIYHFIPRGEKRFSVRQLSLDDRIGFVKFTELKEDDNLFCGSAYTSSLNTIPIRRNYDCNLKLIARDSDNRKLVLLSKVPTPELGKFLDAPKGSVLQICYY